ncbi:MAG: RDD family protein [Wolbachia endosymbiont of Homalodisca vitripennis]|nr:RDD family protein [Wolbachia endosymbiont of Homalodisca vitripennis]MCJ7454018.1 RDD family protein [Wolbachia endosymbiont of Homalodisca vitripennis]MCJ7475538.1 RDD family protein [Wolbachia endosymbiont of Homalodisca vitripennis]
MDTEINAKVNYAGLIKRIAAEILDFVIFFSPLLIFIIFGLLGAFSDDDSSSQTADEQDYMFMIMTTLLLIVPVVFAILMTAKLGGTPGKLLCGMHVKSTNTFKNVTLIQAVIRSILKVVFLAIFPSLISAFCLFLLSSGSDVLDGIFAIIATMPIFIYTRFDQRKQTFYDKIAKTVVVDYKPS